MRYPASEIGFPAQVPGEYVLRHYQKPLVMAIKRELDIRDSEFNQLILPMLINFANFVHLFPASENHHHRAATGLLRHSLEVCFQCIRRSKNIEFDSMAVPVHKSNRALAWRLAVAAGGLLHDLGKPFTDFEVWNEDGKFTGLQAMNQSMSGQREQCKKILSCMETRPSPPAYLQHEQYVVDDHAKRNACLPS